MFCVVTLSPSQVPLLLPAYPLQQFFLDYPGLTPYIGRCMIPYFNNTASLEKEVVPN